MEDGFAVHNDQREIQLLHPQTNEFYPTTLAVF